ncbi:MAG: PDZ domain-containing protein, partial [Bacteroidia bacterium]|nr:PDZ domain-containing protein [Bacteroidia bacterium]
MKIITKYLVVFFISSTFTLSAFSQELARRPFMGVLLAHVTPQIEETSGFDLDKGIYVRKVFENSSAKAAKIKAGDIIYSMDGRIIQDVNYFLQEIAKHKTGDKIKLMIYREGANIEKDLVLTPFPKEENKNFETVYSSVVTSVGIQRTIITKPFGNGPFPAILMVQGVGCVTQDFPFPETRDIIYSIIDSFTNAGYVCMRVERSGIGDSKGKPCSEINFEEDLDGFQKGLRSLRSLEYVDPDLVGIMGFSMGGIVAPVLASKEKVNSIIVYGTASSNWLEYELANSKRQYILNRNTYDSLAQFMRAELNRLHAFYVLGKSPEEIAEKYSEQRSWYIDRMSIYPQHYSYFQQVANLNITEYWANCKSKVLAIHGEADYVSAADDHKQISDIVNSKQKNFAKYIELQDADHWLKNVDDEKESKLRLGDSSPGFNYSFIRLCLNWLNDNPKTENTMKKVTGLGGIFFKCEDPEKTKKWYNDNLGINSDKWGFSFEWKDKDDGSLGTTAWSPFVAKTEYFNPSKKDYMINY